MNSCARRGARRLLVRAARGRALRSSALHGALMLASLALVACVPEIPVAPQVRPTAVGANQWLVEPGDVIRLRTWQTTDLSGELPVNERGQVLVPNVGRVTVQGLTPAQAEAQIVRAYAARIDSSRVEVTFLRPVSVVGGVKQAGVQLADPASTVLSLVTRAGGPTRMGGDLHTYLLRIGEPTHEVSIGDRVSDLGIRSSDQLYVQDPPFVVRNEPAIRSVFEGLQLISTVITVYLLVRR